MTQNKVQSDSILQGDIMTLDALFKRIAERGRKIRSQNTTAEDNDSGRDALSAGQDTNPQEKESDHG